MAEISATLNLRPVRIGLLVRPTDKASVRQFMRLCACLWGGRYNPIIPVSKRLPAKWKFDPLRVSGTELARGYLSFFEPDVLIEAEEGLAELAGYGALNKSPFNPEIVKLSEFVQDVGNGRKRFAFGLSMLDVFSVLYETEHRFVQRDPQKWVYFTGDDNAAFVEAVFGRYPSDASLQEFESAYKEVFRPTTMGVTPDVISTLALDNARSPFSATRYELEVQSLNSEELRIFLFDPNSSLDLIDLWNLRIFYKSVVPVPIDWLAALSDYLSNMINENHRPLPNNNHGVMIRSTVQLSRSIASEERMKFVHETLNKCKKHSYTVQSWYEQLWHRPDRQGPSRLGISSREARIRMNLGEDNATTFETIHPDFASRFGGHKCRWVNVLTFPYERGAKDIALVYPPNNRDRSLPRLAFTDQVIISREGWVFPQEYIDLTASVHFETGESAFANWLVSRGFRVQTTPEGRVAREVLRSLGGTWGVHLISEPETLKLLDEMSASAVVRKNDSEVAERTYDGKSAPVEKWQALISKRGEKFHPRVSLDDFTRRGILSLGLSVACPICAVDNWVGLDKLSYEVRCEGCLRVFSFPQGSYDFRNTPWRYRVIGPFSAPNYAKGAYAVALTVQFFAFKIRSSDTRLTYTTGTRIETGGKWKEFDFAMWLQFDQLLGRSTEPRLIIGEAKSFAKPAIKDKDVAALRFFSQQFPGALLVVSVLKDGLDPSEIALLKPLATAGRKIHDGRMVSPLMILTGNELMGTRHLVQSWKPRGDLFAHYSDNVYHFGLDDLAMATQHLYLGLPPE